VFLDGNKIILRIITQQDVTHQISSVSNLFFQAVQGPRN